MRSIEEELTQVLHDQAESVPPDPRLLTAVKARSRQRAVRHRVALSAAMAATVAVVIVPWQAAELGIHRPKDGQQAAAADGFLVDKPVSLPAFPLTPTYLPPGIQSESMTTSGSSFELAGWWRGPKGVLDERSLLVAVGTEPGIWDSIPGLTASAQSVDGKPGKLLTQVPTEFNPGRYLTLEWERKPGKWVTVVTGDTQDDLDVLLRIAGGLVDRPVTPKWTFAVTRQPADFTLYHFSPFDFEMRLPGGHESDWVRVEAKRAEANTRGEGSSVTVGNRSGWLFQSSSATTRLTLTLRVSTTTVLQFTAQSDGVWTAERLKAFAAGVTYSGPTPKARNN